MNRISRRIEKDFGNGKSVFYFDVVVDSKRHGKYSYSKCELDFNTAVDLPQEFYTKLLDIIEMSVDTMCTNYFKKGVIENG